MCNLFSDMLPQEAMRRLFRASDRLGNQEPLPAVFPDDEASIVRIGEDGGRELAQANAPVPAMVFLTCPANGVADLPEGHARRPAH